jgi:NADPH:quinone reductase-like Zn-dependent oxidoreductase
MRTLHAYARSDPSRVAFEHGPRPTLRPGDVLVRVHASGVSPGELDWPTAWLHHDGTPRTPPIVPGHEVAGVVDAVAPAVTGLAIGDEVFGFIDIRRDGADAEYVAVRADELAPKPATLTHAQAAAVPLSALTAWQALFEHGGLTTGEQVLVHGGGGGVGTFAVQLARWRGARVVATASSRDADLVRGLGADTVGGDTWERSWGVLRRGGRLVSIAVPRPPDREDDDGRQATWFVVRPDHGQLMEIGGLIDAGLLRPIVSATLPLARGGEAYGPSGHPRGPGKAVLLVDDVSGNQADPPPAPRPRPRTAG